MHYQTKPAVVAVTLALSALGQLAYAADSTEVQQMPEVVVHGSRPDNQANGSSLSQTQLAGQAARSSDSAQLLQDIPGLTLHAAGGFSSLPVLRGLADDRLLVKTDGASLIASCPNHMNSPLSYMDASKVDSVQVYNAAAPVSAGGDNIGGVIVAKSAALQFAEPGQILQGGEVGAFYRSNGDARGANASATLANDHVSINYTGSTARSNNYDAAANFKSAGAAASGRAWMDGDTVGSTAYKTENHELGVAWRDYYQLLEAKVGVQRTPYEGFANQRMDMTDNSSDQLNLHYNGQFAWGELDARLYSQYVRHHMDFGNDKQLDYMGDIGMPMDTASHTQGGSLTLDLPLNASNKLKLGTEFQRYQLNDWWPPVAGDTMMMGPETFWNIKNGKRDKLDVFAEWQADWTPQWRSIIGTRLSQVKTNADNVSGYSSMYDSDAAAFNAQSHARTDNNIDFSALTRYIPSATEQYELAFARKTRSPNLYERYTWATDSMTSIMNNFAGDGNGYVGNPNLKPEVANTLSSSLDWHAADGEAWLFRVSPYYSYVQNYIDAKRYDASSTATTGYVVLQYINQNAQLYGVDVSGKLQLAKNTAYGSFDATAQLSYTRGESLTTGDNLYNIMPLNAKLALVNKLGQWTSTAEWQAVRAKTEVSAVRNEAKTPGYSLFNLRTRYETKQFSVDVGIDNVFNRFYTLPLGGAYTGQGATMGINSIAWGVGVPGAARSLYTAFNYKF
ncbi:TonB-dependent receptor [Aquitalea aquatica]|uniref:TonB-dependent receptor plug domain-containing protein n=1 Tax=Aquitalea aquatica TaxID=3044273 RepID=A0A838YGS7_9NEIS|nr:TonB-dependent receptor [Aquitalea magnusonii]MBA4710245.1 TonB-dependent receptor plug domain-containing protein [Aquitalea magnusonii]